MSVMLASRQHGMYWSLQLLSHENVSVFCGTVHVAVDANIGASAAVMIVTILRTRMLPGLNFVVMHSGGVMESEQARMSGRRWMAAREWSRISGFRMEWGHQPPPTRSSRDEGVMRRIDFVSCCLSKGSKHNHSASNGQQPITF